jgi:hypothetical protein
VTQRVGPLQVVSGCFMGIKAPSTPPACPASYYIATGLKGAKYCTPCPPGSTSATPNSHSCTPCPAGTFNNDFGGKCQNCYSEYFSNPGAKRCTWCDTDEQKWTDGKQCTKCPTGSYASLTNIKQCHKCKAGAKCCTVNPSNDCPACPTGMIACATCSPRLARSTTVCVRVFTCGGIHRNQHMYSGPYPLTFQVPKVNSLVTDTVAPSESLTDNSSIFTAHK